MLLDIRETIEFCHALKYKRMLEVDGKKRTSLGTCQFWHKEMICKNGRIA
jgi:hypothetical protein